MLLTCPHCTDIGGIPDILRKFYDMPVACHSCDGVYFLKSGAITEAVFSVRGKNHRLACTSCGLRLLALSYKRPAGHAQLLCPACHEPLNKGCCPFHLARLDGLMVIISSIDRFKQFIVNRWPSFGHPGP